MTDLTKLTAKQRENYHYMADAMRRLEWDLHQSIEDSGRIPPDWYRIARERGPAPKAKVTLLLEQDVLRFFKSMGTGHGARINEVLRVFMHARLAGVIRGAETIDYFKRRDGLHDGERPLWGDAARDMGEDIAIEPGAALRDRMEQLRAEVRRRSEEDL